MTIRVIINGANGKMGQLAVKTIQNESEFTLVGQLGRHDNLKEEIKKTNAQIVIDLTNAEAAFNNALTIIESNAHPIIGTSGLVKKQVEKLQALSKEKKLGGVIAPNFSLGALLMMKYAQEFAKYFNEVEIIEMHHNGKLDSPSGTAVRTAELIAAARTHAPVKPSSTKETVPGARGANYQDISIHSIRLPGVVADQQVIFGGTGETLSLAHRTIDRQCFMPGIVLACKKVTMLNELVYGLEHLL